MKPIKVFFSYTHTDEVLCKKLINHLKILQRQKVIESWYDRRIEAGQEFDQVIKENLNAANIILLLISSDFLASDYCYDIELTRAMERHVAIEAVVIPVILRRCDWAGAPFAGLAALPQDAKPVTAWDDEDEAFTDIARGIRRVAERLAANPR